MSTPGLMYPTQKGMPAGNPRDSAMASMNNANQLQASANKAMAGGKYKRRHKGGADGTVAVPQFQMQYDPQGGPGTNPNNQIQSNAQISTQQSANAVYDSQAKLSGGRPRRCKKGGNPDWNWGCMSGGKTRRHHRKSRRHHRKSRRHHRKSCKKSRQQH
jgi:hypothetical protein